MRARCVHFLGALQVCWNLKHFRVPPLCPNSCFLPSVLNSTLRLVGNDEDRYLLQQLSSES